MCKLRLIELRQRTLWDVWDEAGIWLEPLVLKCPHMILFLDCPQNWSLEAPCSCCWQSRSPPLQSSCSASYSTPPVCCVPSWDPWASPTPFHTWGNCSPESLVQWLSDQMGTRTLLPTLCPPDLFSVLEGMLVTKKGKTHRGLWEKDSEAGMHLRG